MTSVDIASPTLEPKILIFGVGGAGGNAVNNMISSGLQGVNFCAANTDAQALHASLAETKIQLGIESTRGLGAGSNPEVGRIAAEESLSQIQKILEGTHMLFITAGMGGGTGTGTAPIVAKLAKDMGILTVGVVTKPFNFEGIRRMQTAEAGVAALEPHVDTLLVIPNQNLFRLASNQTTFTDAFRMADNVLDLGIRGITDLVTRPGLINLDFADIKSVMSNMGAAMMGSGEAEGENRAIEAVELAISNPLLNNSSMKGAKAVLFNITGSENLTLFELDEAANRVRSEVDPSANIIVGSAFNPELGNKIKISIFATGIDGKDTDDHGHHSVNAAINANKETNKISKEDKIHTENVEIDDSEQDTDGTASQQEANTEELHSHNIDAADENLHHTSQKSPDHSDNIAQNIDTATENITPDQQHSTPQTNHSVDQTSHKEQMKDDAGFHSQFTNTKRRDMESAASFAPDYNNIDASINLQSKLDEIQPQKPSPKKKRTLFEKMSFGFSKFTSSNNGNDADDEPNSIDTPAFLRRNQDQDKE